MGHINDIGAAITAAIGDEEAGLIAVRRDIHAHPELAFHEVRTAGVVARELARLGISCRTGVGRTGVVGTIEGGRPGPVIAIRGDMDALPIEERTGLAFASQNAGLMHACGHDVHTSTLLGVAAILKRLAPGMAGTVRLLFQPAEEVLGGAAAMIGHGAGISQPSRYTGGAIWFREGRQLCRVRPVPAGGAGCFGPCGLSTCGGGPHRGRGASDHQSADHCFA